MSIVVSQAVTYSYFYSTTVLAVMYKHLLTFSRYSHLSTKRTNTRKYSHSEGNDIQHDSKAPRHVRIRSDNTDFGEEC